MICKLVVTALIYLVRRMKPSPALIQDGICVQLCLWICLVTCLQETDFLVALHQLREQKLLRLSGWFIHSVPCLREQSLQTSSRISSQVSHWLSHLVLHLQTVFAFTEIKLYPTHTKAEDKSIEEQSLLRDLRKCRISDGVLLALALGGGGTAWVLSAAWVSRILLPGRFGRDVELPDLFAPWHWCVGQVFTSRKSTGFSHRSGANAF